LNLNNKVTKPTYHVEVQHFPTTPHDLNGIHLISGRNLQKIDYPDVIQEQHLEEEDP